MCATLFGSAHASGKTKRTPKAGGARENIEAPKKPSRWISPHGSERANKINTHIHTTGLYNARPGRPPCEHLKSPSPPHLLADQVRRYPPLEALTQLGPHALDQLLQPRPLGADKPRHGNRKPSPDRTPRGGSTGTRAPPPLLPARLLSRGQRRGPRRGRSRRCTGGIFRESSDWPGLGPERFFAPARLSELLGTVAGLNPEHRHQFRAGLHFEGFSHVSPQNTTGRRRGGGGGGKTTDIDIAIDVAFAVDNAIATAIATMIAAAVACRADPRATPMLADNHAPYACGGTSRRRPWPDAKVTPAAPVPASGGGRRGGRCGGCIGGGRVQPDAGGAKRLSEGGDAPGFAGMETSPAVSGRFCGVGKVGQLIDQKKKGEHKSGIVPEEIIDQYFMMQNLSPVYHPFLERRSKEGKLETLSWRGTD